MAWVSVVQLVRGVGEVTGKAHEWWWCVDPGEQVGTHVSAGAAPGGSAGGDERAI